MSITGILLFTLLFFMKLSPPSHRGGGSPPFRRWHIRKAVKTPIFSITLTKRPLFFTISPKDQIVCCHLKPPFFQKSLNFDAKWHPICFVLGCCSSCCWFFCFFFHFFLQIWSYFHPKAAIFRNILILLAHFYLLSHDAPTFFFFSLSPNTTGCGNLSLTPKSILYWSAPNSSEIFSAEKFYKRKQCSSPLWV